MARGKQSEINRKKIEVDELNKRIRAAELELKVATASGKKDKASEIQSDINGLNSVIRELQDEIINFSDHKQIAAANHIQSHDDVIAKHVGLKKKYKKEYWKWSFYGILWILIGFPTMALGIGFLFLVIGFIYLIKGLARWPKVQMEEMIIPFLEAGLSEEEAIQQIASIKKDVAQKLKKEQRDRELLAQEIARKMGR